MSEDGSEQPGGRDAVTVLPYGDRALLVELGSVERVVGYVDALEAGRPTGVVDVVPAAETVLVVTASAAAARAVREVLEGLEPREAAAAAGSAGSAGSAGAVADDVVEIPVRYAGPDLDEVVRLTGLAEREVVAAHTGCDYRVAFGGFAPGFGYLVGGDPRLHVPRRESARTEVPAGSVGLAGEYSGVYPRSSPGGWQLIGTTDLAMWDLERDPPALLRPGGLVRFVEVPR